MWGAPMWTYFSLMVQVILGNSCNNRECRWIILYSVAFSFLFAIAYAVRNEAGPYINGRPSRIHFPGRELARSIETSWEREYREELTLIGGDWWLAGNAAFYSKWRPTVYAEMDSKISPWANDDEFKQKGGVIVWQKSETGEKIASDWLKRFPDARIESPLQLSYHTLGKSFTVEIGVATIPMSRSSEESNLLKSK